MEGWKAGDAMTAGFYRSNMASPATKRWYICLALRNMTRGGPVRVLRPSTGVSQMQKIDLRQRYSPITSKASALRQWDVWLSGEDICYHGPDCRRGAACNVGKRIQPVHQLTGDADRISELLPRLRQAIKDNRIQHPGVLQATYCRLRDGFSTGLHIPPSLVPQFKTWLEEAAAART